MEEEKHERRGRSRSPRRGGGEDEEEEPEATEEKTAVKRGREGLQEEEEKVAGQEDKKRKEEAKTFENELVGALKRMQEELQKDVAEIYSPPRVTNEAEKFGLRIGEAMDLTTGLDFRL